MVIKDILVQYSISVDNQSGKPVTLSLTFFSYPSAHTIKKCQHFGLLSYYLFERKHMLMFQHANVRIFKKGQVLCRSSTCYCKSFDLSCHSLYQLVHYSQFESECSICSAISSQDDHCSLSACQHESTESRLSGNLKRWHIKNNSLKFGANAPHFTYFGQMGN